LAGRIVLQLIAFVKECVLPPGGEKESFLEFKEKAGLWRGGQEADRWG
jgi:hypothetical protein